MFNLTHTIKKRCDTLATQTTIAEVRERIPVDLSPVITGLVQHPGHHPTRFYSSGTRILHRGLVYRSMTTFLESLGPGCIAKSLQFVYTVSENEFFTARLHKPINIYFLGL